MSKSVTLARSPAQTSGRGTPRFKRPAQLVPAAARMRYGDPFIITSVDGQHCLCPNMFNAGLYLVPVRYAKECGFLSMCCFVFQQLSSDGKGFQDIKSSKDPNSIYICAGDDMNIRHRISGRYIQFDDTHSPLQEPAQSCANMADAATPQSRLRLLYRVSLDAEIRFMLSQSELSICAHASAQTFMCPVQRCSDDFCSEVIFSNSRHSGWVVEATSALNAEENPSCFQGIRCSSLGRIKSTSGLTLSYHPTALFPVFIPLDSVTTDGSWTDPDSVWTIWTFEDSDNCFNMSHSSSSVNLRHVVTSRLVQMGAPFEPVTSLSSSIDASVYSISVAEKSGMKLHVNYIDQHRFTLSCDGDNTQSLVVQCTSMHCDALACLSSESHPNFNGTFPISLASAAPGCSSLHLLAACSFRSESSILLWIPESDRTQHLIYSISPLVIATSHARIELLSQMGAAVHASLPTHDAEDSLSKGISEEIESTLRDGMQAVKNVGAFFSENISSFNEKMMSVGATSVDQVSITGDAHTSNASQSSTVRSAANIEMECLNQLCYVASLVLDPLTDVIRSTCGVIQSEGVQAVHILQSLEVFSVFGEIASLFSSYLVHSLSQIRTGQHLLPELCQPLLNRCIFVGNSSEASLASFYQHITLFRCCIKAQYVGPSAQEVMSEMLGNSVDSWRGLDSLIYLSPSLRKFISSVGEIIKLCAQALPTFHCNSSLFKCILTAVPYYIRCEYTLNALLNIEHVRMQYGHSVLEVAFQRLVLFFKNSTFFSESHLQRHNVSKKAGHQEFWVSEGSFWINIISFLAEQPLLAGMAFRRQIYLRLLEAIPQGGALPAFKAVNGGSSLLVARPSVAQDHSADVHKNQPQNATARWVTSGGLRSVGRGSELEPGWTDLMSCDVQKATTLTMTGNSIPPHEIVSLVSSTLNLYHNLVFHETQKKCIPHLWPDTLQFVCRQCPSEFVIGCLSNPLFSYDIRRAACRLTNRLAFQNARRQFSLPILSWSSEMVIPIHDVESNRTSFVQWINNYDMLKPILFNLLEYFKPEEEYRRPPPFVAIAFLELACEAIANNLWSDLPAVRHLYTIFSGIFLQALAPDQDRERSLRLNAINRHLPFLQKQYIKNIRDGFKFVTAVPGDVVCSGLEQDSDPCIVICQQGELSLCFDDQGNGPVCIKTISSDEILGLETLDFVATNWFNESALSAAPLKLPKCIATRQCKLWTITRSSLLSAVLSRSSIVQDSGQVSNVEIDVRCLASFAMSLCLEQERKAFCLQAVQQIRLHIHLAPGIYIRPTRPFKQRRVAESLSLILGDASASIVESLFRASGGHLLRNSTKVMGFPINRAAGFVFILHMIISLGLISLSILNRLGRVEDITLGRNENPSHEFLAVMFVLWLLSSAFGLHSVMKRIPRRIQWALVSHCFIVVICIIALIASAYQELEQLPYASILSKLSAALLTIFFEGYAVLIVLTYFALLSKKEALRASVIMAELHQEQTDNLLIDHFSKNQLFASSSSIIFSQIASDESRLSETASQFFVSNCQNKDKLSAALESCVLLRTPHAEMVVQALVVASKDLLKNALELIEIILASSHPLSLQRNQRTWPPILKDTGVLSQSGKLVSLLVNLKIKVGVIYDTLRKEAEKFNEHTGGMSPSEWRRVSYASQLDTGLCIIVGVARSICSFSSSFEALRCPSEKGNQLIALCLELLAWCCVEDTHWQEIVAGLLSEVGPTIIFISPSHAAAAIAESCRNNVSIRTTHGKSLVGILCSVFESENVSLFQKPQLESILRALRVLVAGSIVSATIPVEGLGEIVIQHTLLFAANVLEDLGSVKCRFIAIDDGDVRDRYDMNAGSVSDRQLVPCGRCEGTGMQKGFKCCFCDGRRYVSVSLSQNPSISLFDEHELSIAPKVADSVSKVQAFGIRSVTSSGWWLRSGENCCVETLNLLAVTCEIGNHFLSSQIREIVSFDCAAKAACDPTASQELRAALVRFCASVHVPAAVANHSDRRWVNPVHPAWLITDALSRFVQDSPISRLDDVSLGLSSPAFVLLSIWTPVIELLCKRVLALSTRPTPKPIKEILRRCGDSICISGCSSTNVTICQNALSSISVLRALDLNPQSSLFQTFDAYITHEIFTRNAQESLKISDLSASTSDISAMRWKSYISAIKPPEEHIEHAIASHLIQAEPGIHLSTSVASTIAFNLCSSCRKGGFFFDQHDTWNNVVRGITQAIEASTAKLHNTNISPIKWLSEGVCSIIIDSISMAATPSNDRFAHSSGGLYLGIRFLHSFKNQGQEMLLKAVLKQPSDNFFAGLISIIEDAAVAAPRVASVYNQVVQSLKKEKSSREAALSQIEKSGNLTRQLASNSCDIEESQVWQRLDHVVGKSTGCTLSQRLAFGGLVAKFIQCWCEDHNAHVQDAFAGLRPKGTSNPILSLVNLVLVCSRQACSPLQIITSLALDAITESIQRPCKLQQVAVAQTDLVHACDDLILGRWSDGSDSMITFSHNCPLDVPETLRSVMQAPYSLSEIRSKSCSVLLSLVESLDNDTLGEFSTPMLILKAMRIEEHKKSLILLDHNIEEDRNTCVSIVVVLLTLQPFIPKYGVWAAKASCIKSILQPESQDDIPIMAHIRNRIRCVDVVRKGVLNRVWFPQPDVMECTRSDYLETIQRSIFNPGDHDAQCMAFCLLSLALIEQMLLDQSLTKHRFSKILKSAIHWFQYLFNLNAILINVIMLFAFEHMDETHSSTIHGALFFTLSSDINFRNSQFMYTLRALSIIQFCFSFFMFSWFMVTDVSFIVRERIRQNPEWMKVFVNKRGGPEHFVIWCRSVGSNPRFCSLFAYLIASILAISLPDRLTPMLFLSLHLADVVYISKDMKVVLDFISSVWHNLVTVIGFIFILLNIFGAVGFIWIPDWFEFPETNADWYPAVNGSIASGDAVEATCSTLWRCFLVQVDKGLVLGDVDYGIISTYADTPPEMMYSRIFYSFVFQVVVGILFSFILYTIVIDSFSKFRMKNDELDFQIKNKCLICGLGRDELESMDSFESHIVSVHGLFSQVLRNRIFRNFHIACSGLFDYVAFIAMIILKDRSTLTGPESSVFNCIVDVTPTGIQPKAKPDTSWLPFRRVSSQFSFSPQVTTLASAASSKDPEASLKAAVLSSQECIFQDKKAVSQIFEMNEVSKREDGTFEECRVELKICSSDLPVDSSIKFLCKKAGNRMASYLGGDFNGPESGRRFSALHVEFFPETSVNNQSKKNWEIHLNKLTMTDVHSTKNKRRRKLIPEHETS